MLAWVIGSGGLLGSHVLQALDRGGGGLEAWVPEPSRVPWSDPAAALVRLEQLAERFALAALERKAPSWALLWCAGSGVVGTPAGELAQETGYLERLLALLGERLAGVPGKVLLASSAGGVYGDNPEQPLTEASACRPISDYGRNKLRQEQLLQDWARSRPEVSTLVARISNLYGPGQDVRKRQGLIGHISRSLLHHAPVHVFVPLDTLRDYVYVTDCAAQLVCATERLAPGEHVLKIFHGGETVTIAGIIGAFGRIAKGHPRIICSPTATKALQPARLQFRSQVWTDLPRPVQTGLVAGIQRVHQHQLSLFQRGLLPPSKQAT